jgi:hypothetical protein
VTTTKAYALVHENGCLWRSNLGSLAIFYTHKAAEAFRDGGADTRRCLVVAVNIVDDSSGK